MVGAGSGALSVHPASANTTRQDARTRIRVIARRYRITSPATVTHMTNVETAEMLARQRYVTAPAILEGRVDMRSYPFRYLAIHANIHIGGERVAGLLAAIEVVEKWGWELVTILEYDKSVYAFMRRTTYQPTLHPAHL